MPNQKMKSSKVYSINVRSPSSQISSFSPSHRKKTLFGKPFAESLEKSRAAYDKKLHASNLALNEILLEQKCSHSYWNFLFSILGPLATFLMDYGAFVLWPMENAFTHPGTWWGHKIIRYVMPAQVDVCDSFVFILVLHFPLTEVDVHAQMWDSDDKLDGTDHPLLCWVLVARWVNPCCINLLLHFHRLQRNTGTCLVRIVLKMDSQIILFCSFIQLSQRFIKGTERQPFSIWF